MSRPTPRVVLLAGVALSVLVSACEPNRFVTGWVATWTATSGRAVIDDPGSSSLLGEVSPMWFVTDDDATVDQSGSSTNLSAVVSSLRAKGLPVVPAIFDSQPSGVMRRILDDPTQRRRHVRNIVDLVVARNFDGIDLDYEVFAFGDSRSTWDSIRPDWISFVRELGAALHARGKVLSVTIPAVWRSGTTTTGYWVYAQQDIAPHVDRIRIMVYDWSVSTAGPIGPMWWVRAVIDYSTNVAKVHPSRLQLGIPAYGRHWAVKRVATQTCPDGAVFRDSITLGEAAPLAAANRVTPVRHSSGELTFSWVQYVSGTVTGPVVPPSYTPPSTVIDRIDGPARPLSPATRLDAPATPISCEVLHTVFVPDAVNLRQRAEAALAARWSGVAVWALGYETADVYEQFGTVERVRPNGSASGAFVSLAVVPDTRTLRATGYAYHPEFDLPVAVRLTATNGSGTTLTRTVTARAARTGMPTGLGPFHGFDERFDVASGTWTVCATAVLWGGATGPNLGCRTLRVA